MDAPILIDTSDYPPAQHALDADVAPWRDAPTKQGLNQLLRRGDTDALAKLGSEILNIDGLGQDRSVSARMTVINATPGCVSFSALLFSGEVYVGKTMLDLQPQELADVDDSSVLARSISLELHMESVAIESNWRGQDIGADLLSIYKGWAAAMELDWITLQATGPDGNVYWARRGFQWASDEHVPELATRLADDLLAFSGGRLSSVVNDRDATCVATVLRDIETFPISDPHHPSPYTVCASVSDPRFLFNRDDPSESLDWQGFLDVRPEWMALRR
jgi:hypothetical protein